MSRRFDEEITLGGPGTSGDEASATLPPSTPSSANLAARTPIRRFEPGSVVAGRYRLVALLGKGGMGEVYRAEDLTLDQPVALKFLPEGVAAEGPALAQFHNELRIARQVSHKNVCRLYDLGEADGRRFLTMEYVDGEDLASLLRRIGRIPQDKAIQLARQLCAGLSAAHEKGVLHRDLKPANVMIDGNGDVRLTDFGIAVAAGDAGATLAGTPQYMAPEQLQGSPASVATDIYSLGLILFELFTGTRIHGAKSVAEVLEFHKSGIVATPTTVVKDLDPAIERVIMRCLDRDPAKRPQSALAVAATLPGHDPIAAALAAGETPSPDLLSAAAETDAASLPRALALVAVYVTAVIAFLFASPPVSFVGVVPFPKSTDVLIDRADQLFGLLGYTTPYEDRAYGMWVWTAYQTWVQKTHADWRAILSSQSPSPALLWYRTSPRSMNPGGTAVDFGDPPESTPGMRFALYESGGRLIQLRAVPPFFDVPSDAGAAPDWRPLFDAAGLDRSTFSTVRPERVPSKFADHREAWNGLYAGRSDLPIHIEAASYKGRPTSFEVLGPWEPRPPTTQDANSGAGLLRWGTVVSNLVLLALFLAAAFSVWRNLRLNRADLRGAKRLAWAIILASIAVWIVSPHGSSLQTEVVLFGRNLADEVLWAGAFWVFFVALDPYARRIFPDGLLGWSRLLSGHVRDTRVGRDMLVGLAVGAIYIGFDLAYKWSQIATVHGSAISLLGNELGSLAHPASIAQRWFASGTDALLTGFLPALVFIGGRMTVKRTWLAGLITVALLALVANNGAVLTGGWLQKMFILLRAALMTYTIIRAGLLAMITGSFVADVLLDEPITGHLGAWYATPSIFSLLLLALIVWFAFYAARGRQPLLGSPQRSES